MNVDIVILYITIFVFNCISGLASYKKTNHKVYFYNILFWVGCLLNLFGQAIPQNPQVFGLTIGIYTICNYSLVRILDNQLNIKTDLSKIWIWTVILLISSLILIKTTNSFMAYSLTMVSLTNMPLFYFGVRNFKKVWDANKAGKIFILMLGLGTAHSFDFPFLRLEPMSNTGFLLYFIYVFNFSFLLNRITNEVYLDYMQGKIKEVNEENQRLVQTQAMNSMMIGISHEMNTALQVLKSGIDIIDENENLKVIGMMKKSIEKIEKTQNIFKKNKNEDFNSIVKIPNLMSDVCDFLQVRDKIKFSTSITDIFSNKVVLINVLVGILNPLLLKNKTLDVFISEENEAYSIKIKFNQAADFKENHYHDFLVVNSLLSQINGSITLGDNLISIQLFSQINFSCPA